jgi:formylglycine-generating enzyme required for sulfatase activity
MLVYILIISTLLIHADDQRGFIKIKDKAGQEVGLYENSYALLIGVSEYTNGWPKLPGVKNDIPLVRVALENQGFKVIVVENPTYEQLEQAYRNFINNYAQKSNDRVLLYFSGHGHTMKLAYGADMGYIVPADAANPNIDEAGFRSKAMSMQQIEVYAKQIQSKHAMFMFYSCFSGSIFDITRAVPENISYKTSKPVRQIVTAGAADETVPDKSIFCQQFVEALNGEGDTDKDGYITGVELGEFLQKKVINYSRDGQHPQYGKIRDPLLDKGDFVFNITTASSVTVKPAITTLPTNESTQLEVDKQSLKTNLPNEITGNDSAPMLLIPAGWFQMGSKDDKNVPLHKVQLDAFYMDKYEVTNILYSKFLSATNRSIPKDWNNPKLSNSDQPVVNVSWEDAKAYAEWAGKRLPTEAEWEKAARGGLLMQKYPFGNGITGYDANCLETGYKCPSTVGQFKPNGYGLYDMSGNVWEWCTDWYDDKYYSIAPDQNPKGPELGNKKVIRGGSWRESLSTFMTATQKFPMIFERKSKKPSDSSDNVGFRCAMDAPK